MVRKIYKNMTERGIERRGSKQRERARNRKKENIINFIEKVREHRGMET